MKHLVPLLQEKYSELFQFLAGLTAGAPLGYPAELQEAAAEAIVSYLELLIEWTPRVDLVAPASPEKLIERHVIDSLAAGMLLSAISSAPQLDVGSGAGLPGIILAIMQPERRTYLLEPREKRAIFLSESVRRLGLTKSLVLKKRLEEARAADFPEPPGIAVFRALRLDAAQVQSVKRLLTEDSCLAYLGGVDEGRVSALPGGRERVVSYGLGPAGPSRFIKIIN